jgi:antitoxin component YwqK of YwqJK toxin-antitoxin module
MATKSKAIEFIKYHIDGTLWAKGQTINETPDGSWEWFRKDGTKLRSGYFNKGKQVGEWTTYNQEGKVYKVTKMKE